MPLRPRVRRIGRALATISIVGLAAVWLCSGWSSVYWSRVIADRRLLVTVSRGNARVYCNIDASPRVLRLAHVNADVVAAQLRAMIDGQSWTRRWDWSWPAARMTGSRPTSAVMVQVPLWTLVLALVLPAAWLWRPHSGGASACPSCRYDRSGLPEGSACPECGSPAAERELLLPAASA